VDPSGNQPGQYWQPVPQPHPRSTTVLVLGILGLVVFSPLAVVAWIMGASVRRDMAAHPGQYGPSPSNTAGWILGIVGTIAMAIILIGVVMWLANGNQIHS